MRHHRLADLASPAMQRVRPPIDARLDELRRGFRPHVAGGANAALESPRLEVESVRIGETARALEPHREPPALARDESWRERGIGALDALGIPRERDGRWHRGAACRDLLDVEEK